MLVDLGSVVFANAKMPSGFYQIANNESELSKKLKSNNPVHEQMGNPVLLLNMI